MVQEVRPEQVRGREGLECQKMEEVGNRGQESSHRTRRQEEGEGRRMEVVLRRPSRGEEEMGRRWALGRRVGRREEVPFYTIVSVHVSLISSDRNRGALTQAGRGGKEAWTS